MSETTVNFTLDDVVAKVREVAAERPTLIYNNEGMSEFGSSCFYRHGEDRSRPGCIVGQALDRLGYVVPDHCEGIAADEILANIYGVAKWEPRVQWVRRVQGEQDGGKPWGEAVQFADSYSYIPVPA